MSETKTAERTLDQDQTLEMREMADDTANLPALHASEPRRGFTPAPMAVLNEIAEMMASSGPMVPPQFQIEALQALTKDKERGREMAIGRCRAVAYQADRWGFDPIAVCQKAYVTVSDLKDNKGNVVKDDGDKPVKVERIGYEAQLVHAVILALAPLVKRPRIAFGYADPNKRTPAQRFCRVEYDVRNPDGTVATLPVQSPALAQIKIRNSPLWLAFPDQQLGYFTARAGARRHFPDVLMGVYTRDELEYVEAQDLSPKRSLYEDDAPPTPPHDAEFEPEFGDAPPPLATDETAYQAWEDKQNGVDSRDPRGAPGQEAASAGASGGATRANPPPPAQESGEPEKGASELLWARERATGILAMEDIPAIEREWQQVRADKRWSILKAYNQAASSVIVKTVADHVKKLRAAQAAGADPSTGEVK